MSRRAQSVRINGDSLQFAAGESVVAEHSYKYSVVGFSRLAERAGLRVERVWTDARRWYGLFWIRTGRE